MSTKNIVYASSLKGYCPLHVCMRFLCDVASQLVALHESGRSHGQIDLQHVEVQEQRFVLLEGESVNNASPENDIWNLAASIFELMLGSPILNGDGEASLKPQTPIPSLPQSGTATLNRLLHRCLCYERDKRPSAKEVLLESEEIVRRESTPSRPPRIHTVAHSQETLGKVDRQWPERMLSVSKRAILLLVLLLGTFILPAQVTLDATDEVVTQKMLDAVLLLRKGDAKSWNTAQSEFRKRQNQITLMDELFDPEHDCPLVSGQIKTFGVNRIFTDMKHNQPQNTGQPLLDGSDPHFNYSLYEKGIKAGKTALYTLSGRTGRQVFLVVPYSAKQPYTVELIRQDGTVIPATGKDANGVTYFIVNTADGPNSGEILTLKIQNKDSINATFVIINHNYRDK